MRSAPLLGLVLALAWNLSSAGDALPEWLAQKIAKMENMPPAAPARSVYRVEFGGRSAYLLTPTCCDIPAELYAETGELICYPYGGFAPGDSRCPGFPALRTTAPLWRDTRGHAKVRPTDVEVLRTGRKE